MELKTKNQMTEEILEQASENIIYDVCKWTKAYVVDTNYHSGISELQIELEEDFDLFEDGKIYTDVVCEVRLKLEKLIIDGSFTLLFKLVD